MSNKFIAIQEATNPFARVMKPRKKWFENIYMSSLIEVDNSLYRVVCTLSRLDKRNLRKIIICTEHGRVVRSKKLTEKVIRVIVYLHYFQVFANNIAFDVQQSGDSQFDVYESSLNNIYSKLYKRLSIDEQKTMQDQLNYYTETKRAVDNLAERSRACLDIVERLKSLTINDVLTEEFLEQIHRSIVKRGQLRGNIESLILKNGISTRKAMIDILNNERYSRHIPNHEDKLRVITETNNADNISKSIIQKGKMDWKFYEKWLGKDRGAFTIEKFISELSHLNEAELFIHTNVNIVTKEHLVGSPNLKY